MAVGALNSVLEFFGAEADAIKTNSMLEKEAFGLNPGELSGVLAVGDKFVLLRCLGLTKPVVTDMSAVRDELAKDIREKKIRLAMNDEFDRIKKSAQIDNFLAKTTQMSPSNSTNDFSSNAFGSTTGECTLVNIRNSFATRMSYP